MHNSIYADLIRERFQSASPSRRAREALYLTLRQLILDGALGAGEALPPSRLLAGELGLGRSTVVRVYEQLLVEGYLCGRSGSGTFVSEDLPPPMAAAAPRGAPAETDLLSRRGSEIERHATSSRIQGGAFVPGVPDVGLFPFTTWRRLLSKNLCFEQRHLARYSQGGFGPLKSALADYLRASRMMHCAPAQILILNGSHQAIDLCARMLCDPGDHVWMEDPGYWGARNVLRANGLGLVPVPVDTDGMVPEQAPAGASPRLVFVSPSCQYPTGVTMSLARRLQLLETAQRHEAWIIEDDYDNEIRYHPHIIGSLFGQAEQAGYRRVLYLGTFSKTMFPGLRLAYLVVPEALAASFSVGNAELYREGRLVEQAALAEFIEAGHFSRHLRRMRNVYQERRAILRSAIESRLGRRVYTAGGQAGLNLAYLFREPLDDVELSRRAMRAGIVFRPMSMYYDASRGNRNGMNLGFAAVAAQDISIAAERLCAVIDEYGAAR